MFSRRGFAVFVTPMIGALAIALMLMAAAATAPRLDDSGYGVSRLR